MPKRFVLGTAITFLVPLGFFIGGTSRDHLLQQTATLDLSVHGTAEARAAACEEIRVALAKADLEALAPSLAGRFRIEATPGKNQTEVTIAWYGPVWSEKADLARILACHVQEQTDHTYQVDNQEDRFTFPVSFPPVFVRTFLDNGSHWIQRKPIGEATAPPWLTLPSWFTPPPPPGPTDRPVYVDARNEDGWQNGKSWKTAYSTIQKGIDAAAIRGIGGVWVAQGIYDEQRHEEGAVRMRRIVHVYGGFAGHETSRDERDWIANPTVIDGSTARGGEAAYHVVVGADYASLDGFTITGGRANKEGLLSTDSGGGMFNKRASPTVAHCVFHDNHAKDHGGGMFNHECTPRIIDCLFTQNEANAGGGLMNFSDCAPVITGCSFIGNRAEYGGGVQDHDSSPVLTDCLFSHNVHDRSGSRARCGGGGSAYYTSSENGPTLTNCVFFANLGEPAFECHTATAFFKNCTFSGNPEGAVDGGDEDSLAALVNCIVWGNSEEELRGNVSVEYSNVRGGAPGEGNADADPWFVDGAAGDLRLLPQSPCLDIANTDAAPETDFAGTLRPQGPAPDMGAYESSFSLEKEKEAKRNQL